MSDQQEHLSDRDRVDNFLAKTIDTGTRKIIWGSTDSILNEGPVENPESAGKTGLALGYVQSGKTTVITTLIAAAADQGYQVVIALLGTKNILLDQNLVRLHEALDLDDRKDYRWIEVINPKGIKKADEIADWARRGRVLFLPVLKHHGRIKALAGCLEASDLAHLPTLIIDDEADQASLNTEAQRDSASRTFDAINELRSKQPNHLFVQFTATPYGPLLLEEDDPLLPNFVEFLHPGPGYTGGKEFFVDHADKTIRKINLRDEQTPKKLPTQLPDSLKTALITFFTGAATLMTKDVNAPPISMLVHSTQRKDIQGRYHYLIERVINDWRDKLAAAQIDDEFLAQINQERELLTENGITPLDDTKFYEKLELVLNECKCWLINSESELKKVDWHITPIHLLVGGNKLDRGFTVEGLTVTYMNRPPSAQVDTLEQRARAFGYRSDFLPYCQFFATQRTLEVLRDVVFTEYDLRAKLRDHLDAGKTVTEWGREIGLLLPKRTRPTREAVLTGLKNFRKSKSGWHSLRHPSLDSKDIRHNKKLIEGLGLAEAPRVDYSRLSHPTLVMTLEEMRQNVIERWRYPLTSPGWHQKDIQEVLDRYADQSREVLIVLMAQQDGQPRLRKWDELGFVNLFQGRDNAPQPNGEFYPGDLEVPRNFSEDIENVNIALQVHFVSARDNQTKPLYTLALYLGGLETFKRRAIDVE
ncbi:Z1 domain-containing protein [Arenicellales bacterium nBUS_45]